MTAITKFLNDVVNDVIDKPVKPFTVTKPTLTYYISYNELNYPVLRQRRLEVTELEKSLMLFIKSNKL
jgi:hypothetical protein